MWLIIILVVVVGVGVGVGRKRLWDVDVGITLIEMRGPWPTATIVVKDGGRGGEKGVV